MLSVIAWTLSHNPFWKGLIPAVVHVRTLSIDITFLISSELNSPPLSVNIAPSLQIHLFPVCHQRINYFIWFLPTDEHRYSVSRPHVNDVQNPFVIPLLRSIATFLLNAVANSRVTTSLGGVLANNLQISHFRSMSDTVP